MSKKNPLLKLLDEVCNDAYVNRVNIFHVIWQKMHATNTISPVLREVAAQEGLHVAVTNLPL